MRLEALALGTLAALPSIAAQSLSHLVRGEFKTDEIAKSSAGQPTILRDTNSNSFSKSEMDVILEAASISRRVYKFTKKESDKIKPNEEYFETKNGQDAVAIAKYDDKCIIAFRGTKPIESTEYKGRFDILPEFHKQHMIDILVNAHTVPKLDAASKTDASITCEIGKGYHGAYYNDIQAGIEAYIDEQCVAEGLPLIFTGHSQGAGLAQIGALRYESKKPWVINFAPAPTFFDRCTAVPHEQITNFVNTEEDWGTFSKFTGGALVFEAPVQYDIIPFADVFVEDFIDDISLMERMGVPEGIAADIASKKATDFFVGSYKGEFFVLNPNKKPSAAYQRRHSGITDSNKVELDIFDIEDYFLADHWGEVAVSAHDMNSYEEKIKILFKNRDKVVAEGFAPFTWCNPGDDWMCTDFCSSIALCSTGAVNEPCFEHSDCKNGGHCDFNMIGKLRCEEAKALGEICNENSDCESGRCDNGGVNPVWKCRSKKGRGAWCNADADCESGNCKWLVFECA